MQRSTTLLIDSIIIQFSLEVDETWNLVILRSHVQYIELGVVRGEDICSDFDQVMNEFNVPIEWRIEQGCKSFRIFLVDPSCNFVFGLFFVYTLTGFDATLHQPRSMHHIQFNKLFLIVEAKMMQYIILLAIPVLAEI